MHDHYTPQGHPIPPHLIAQLSMPTAAQMPAGSNDGFAATALAADPSALGALTMLLQQIEHHKLDTVICPDILAHAKRIHDGGFSTAPRDDTAERVACCDRKVADLTVQHDRITSHERWEEKRELARRIKGAQIIRQVVLDLAQ